MNAAQTNLYFYEWAKARKWYLEHGIDPKQADHKRHWLHKQALGFDKSSKDFTNADLDKVLAAFRAVHDGGNLDAQLDAMEAPVERKTALLDACSDAAKDLYELGDTRLQHPKQQLGYIEGIARKVCFRETAHCTEAQIAKVLGILRRHVARLREKNPQLAEAMDARRKEAVPF